MNNTIKVAKKLVALAKELCAMSRFTDFDGQDTGTDEERNSNGVANRDYEEILKKRYETTPDVSNLLILMGRGLDRHTMMSGGKKGTMTNGNLYLKYNAFPARKEFIIMALISKKGRLLKSDVPDVINMFKFLSKYVEEGYTIETDCNEYSIPFLATFALWKGYYFHAGNPRMEFGETGNKKDASRSCICSKFVQNYGENNASEFAQKEGGLLWKLLKEADQI